MNLLNFISGGPSVPFIQAYAMYLPIILIWSLIWKGLALWHSGRRGQAWWFVILGVVNTIGLLEIIYLFLVAKLKLSELFSKKM